MISITSFLNPRLVKYPIPWVKVHNVPLIFRATRSLSEALDRTVIPYPSVQVGPCANFNGIHRCTSADYTYAGTGCRQSDECGRGLSCACSPQGGGRYRCLPDGAHQAWEAGRKEWNSIWQPWFSCLESNQCSLNDFSVGSCGYKHCLGQANIMLKPSLTCAAANTLEISYANYNGYMATINAGSHIVPSFIMMSALSGLIYALLH